MTHFAKILVPLDKSDLSKRALDTALAIGDKFDAEVILMYVQHDTAALAPGETDRDLAAIEQRCEDLLNWAEERRDLHGFTGGTVRAEVRAGDPTDAIITAANDLMVDMVVMGTHGRQGLFDRLVGSTTERVAAAISASVLAVKPEGFPFLRE